MGILKQMNEATILLMGNLPEPHYVTVSVTGSVNLAVDSADKVGQWAIAFKAEPVHGKMMVRDYSKPDSYKQVEHAEVKLIMSDMHLTVYYVGD